MLSSLIYFRRKQRRTLKERAIQRRSLLSSVSAAFVATPLFAQRGRRGVGRDAADDAFPTPRNDAKRRIVEQIQEMARNRGTYLRVPPADGRLPGLLTETTRAKRVVEAGSSTGDSRLFFRLALVSTDGELSTFEIDSARAETARQNFEREAAVGKYRRFLLRIRWLSLEGLPAFRQASRAGLCFVSALF